MRLFFLLCFLPCGSCLGFPLSATVAIQVTPTKDETPAIQETQSPQPTGDSPDRANLSFAKKTGVVKSDRIQESSGIAFSFHRQDLFWTINDSGHSAHVYGLNLQGELLAVIELKGANNRDWESMSRFSTAEGNFLIVADVGDNNSRYPLVQLYIFAEPKFERADQPVMLIATPIKIDFVYDNGPRDCEAVAVDPQTKDIWLFEKIMGLNFRQQPGAYVLKSDQWLPMAIEKLSQGQGKLLPAAIPESNPSPRPLTALRHCNLRHRFLTGGDFSPDGQSLILRTYSHGLLYQKGTRSSWEEALKADKPILIPLPLQRQGEAIAFTADSQSALITSEFVKQPLWLIDVAGYLEHLEKNK